MREIKIAGAGLAGLTAAINLAKAGYKVKIFEKNSTVGAGHIGDFEGLENWTSKEDILDTLQKANIRTSFPHWPTFSGSFYGPGLKTVSHFSDSKPVFYLIKRGCGFDCLDFHLYQQAKEVGVEFIFGRKINPSEVDIVATGSFRAGSFRADASVLGYVFETNTRDVSFGIFDKELAPGAYAYLLIRNGQGTFAAGGTHQFQRRNEQLNKSIEVFKQVIKFEIKNQRMFSGPFSFRFPPLMSKEGKLYCGEAAGFQDFFGFFGMRYAIVSGFLAAKSIIEGTSYDELCKEQFYDYLKVGLINRFLFELVGNKGYKFLVWCLNRYKDNICTGLYKQYSPRWYKNPFWLPARLWFKRYQ